MTELIYQKLNKNNYDNVLKIKHQLFPESNSDKDYNKYFSGEIKSNYYLILSNNKACATIGWYDFDNQNNNAFVGWFGVIPEYQNKKIGTEILKFILDEVKSLGYKYLRVYTDKIENFISTKLYDKVFDIKEDYSYHDKIGQTNNFIIYTKFLSDKKELWDNRPLNEDENYIF